VVEAVVEPVPAELDPPGAGVEEDPAGGAELEPAGGAAEELAGGVTAPLEEPAAEVEAQVAPPRMVNVPVEQKNMSKVVFRFRLEACGPNDRSETSGIRFDRPALMMSPRGGEEVGRRS